ncbi:MAG: oligopeptide ABC transporter permease OppB [Treponema sp.]|jgi:oligopeptide transport system permease protein|nr:oligopeptide ABC transporter permease OppB [Treponema sp.]
MGKFIVRRFLSLIPTLFLIVTFSFFLIRLAPGGPFSSEKKVTPEVMANLMHKYHMDEPLGKQYLRYLGDMLHGDLGPSFKNKDYTVNQLIAGSMPNSMILGLSSLVIAVVLGIAAGLIAALKKNSWADYTAMSLASIGLSIPLFVVGPLAVLIFAMKLKWLPTSGWITGRNGIKTLIMPALTLALPYFSSIARLTRASVLEVLRSDYIRTARAKGLKDSVIMVKHVLKGALIPVVSYLGPAFAGIVTGSVVIEQIFLVPGIGNFFVKSALNRDYTLIMGTVIVYSVILVLMNFVVDILYGFLDPRISYK